MTRSEVYWRNHNHKYPWQIDVEHMSPQDPNPRDVPLHKFLRVPFGGRSYWGFSTAADLLWFKTTYP